MRRIVTDGPARWLALGSVAVLLLAACGNSGNGTDKTLTEPSTVHVLAGLNDQADANVVVTEYLPEAVSVVAGSTVEWRFVGLERHSVTFLPPGRTLPAPGTPEAQALAKPSTPPVTAYDGTSLVSSGLLPDDPTTAPTFGLTFLDEGEYSYVCVIHPRMTGKITVAGRDSTVDTQATINQRADRELNMWLTEGEAAKKTLTDAGPKQVKNEQDGSTAWTYEMGVTTEHADVHAFAPKDGEIRPGDSVTFVNNSQSSHTATFPQGQPVPQDPNDPAVVAPTGPSPLALQPEGGPYNSGILPPASPTEPAGSFTFFVARAGTYSYVCVPHGRSLMRGSIKVA